MKGVVIKYLNYSSSVKRQPIAGFSLGGKPWVTCGTHKVQMVVNCTCGSNNWTDNGRTMNEYECASCGEFILTEPINGE